MQELANLIGYYRDCYASDLKSVNLINFFNKDVNHQFTFDSFDHLTGSIINHPINSEWGKTVDEELAIHSKEKELFTGSFFIKGKLKQIGKTITAFAPLYLHETILIFENGVYYVSIDKESPIFNPAFIELIKTEIELDSETEKKLIDALPIGKFDFEALIKIKESLNTFIPSLDTSSIDALISNEHVEKNLQKLAGSRSSEHHFKLITGSAIGLTKKSKGARGIIQELDIIHQDRKFPKLLRHVFGTESSRQVDIKANEIYTPTSLSQNQTAAIHSLQSNDTTLIVGPPGTGKTFTISNIAAHLIGEGKSALIACKTAQASRVIINKIQQDLGIKGKAINATSLRYKRSLISKLDNAIYGLNIDGKLAYKKSVARKELNSIKNKIDKLVSQMMDSEKDEIKWGELYFSDKNKFIKLFQSKWIEFKKGNKLNLNSLAKEIHRLERLKRKKSKQFILNSSDSSLSNSLLKSRKDFITLIEALNEKIGNIIHYKFETINFQLILEALPIWICTTENLHNILPLKAELFDVAIIDEATQCDIASAIPLLYRAKKTIVVGDPKQLRHVSFLSKAQESTLQKKNNLIQNPPLYRTNSILDVVNQNIASQNQVVFLNEHFRSAPSIIDFSNQYFYAQSLTIMTDLPSSNEPTNHISITQTEGERNSKGINEKEAEFLFTYISKIITSENKLNKNFKSSFGILSPFRAQVDHIKKTIRNQFSSAQIKDHRILIGTPFHFQGEERDIMCISFALDDKAHHSSFQYLNKEDVFNVSITRARKSQVVFTSLNFEQLDQKYLISKYLNSISNQLQINKPEFTQDDNFIKEVSFWVNEIYPEAKAMSNFMLGGIEIDLVISIESKTYCIDLIGYPGDFAPMFSPEKIKMLRRMNLDIFFIAYSDWNLDKSKCVSELRKFLEQ